MKKILFALFAILALSFSVISCSDGAGMEVLTAEDLKNDSWLKGTWSGTTKTTTKALGENAIETSIDIVSAPYTKAALLTIINAEADLRVFGSGVTQDNTVKANALRTKLYIETITKTYLADEEILKVVTKTNLTKD